MSKLIQIDGQEGGGQMLRTALSLAMITGQPFRMTNIRGKRPKPGLMRQHLTCVRAAVEISDGTADGAEIGSTELVFRAGKVRGGDHRFAIGTAGSTGLLFQTLLPALLHADGASTLQLEGGTHNPLAPPFEFLDHVFLPALRRMGADATISLLETGFAPAGGGIMEAVIQPSRDLSPAEFHDRGELRSTNIRVPVRHLGLDIAGRILDSALATLPCEDAVIERREPGPGRGVTCLVSATFDHVNELTSALGEMGVMSEAVGHRAAKAMRNHIQSGLPVGRWLADQLLLPMALAGGGGFTTGSLDSHVATNISVIGKFLPVKFQIDSIDRGRNLIRVHE